MFPARSRTILLLAAAVLVWASLRNWEKPADIDLSTYDFTLNNRGRLFLLQKEDAGDIYLFGTFHSNDPRVLELPDQVANALAIAETFVTESRHVYVDREKSVTGVAGYFLPLEELRKLCVLPLGESMTSILGESLVADLERAFNLAGREYTVALDKMQRMRPYCALGLLAVPEAERRRGTAILDDALIDRAIEQGKTPVRLESFHQQYRAMLAMPAPLQAEEVRVTLELLETGQMDSHWNANIESYLAGENDNRNWPESLSEAYKDYIEREFVIVRNRGMAERILDLADSSAMFVATGASHLAGEEGLVNLLAREGYSVTVLEPPP